MSFDSHIISSSAFDQISFLQYLFKVHLNTTQYIIGLGGCTFQGIKRKRDHVGIKANYTQSQQECLQEIGNYEEGQQINYFDLARRYNLKNKAGTCKCYLNVNNFHGGTFMRSSIQKREFTKSIFGFCNFKVKKLAQKI